MSALNKPDPQRQTHLILGGARSGKSAHAETVAIEHSNMNALPLIYLATATAGDQEMVERIARHQSDRDKKPNAEQNSAWQLIEEPINLAKAIRSVPQTSVILIDCLTLWLSNCLHASPPCWKEKKQEFTDSIELSQHSIIMVSNEVGQGITPMGSLSRQYVDEIGWLHQELAKQCQRVTQVIAGLPQTLK